MITDGFTKTEEVNFMKTIGRYRPKLSKKEQKSRVNTAVQIRNRRYGNPTVIEVFGHRYHLQRNGGA